MMAMNDVRDEDRPVSFGARALQFALGILMLSGFSGALSAVVVLFFVDIQWGPATWWRVTITPAVSLLIGLLALWGLKRLRPLTGADDPVSPAIRRTNNLFALSGLVCVPGVLLLALSTVSKDDPFALFSNSPVVPWIAIFAIAGWLLGMAIGWWWYVSADEHERQAYDFGNIAGAGLFTAVAPVWWVAARAGLAPQPDVMILWVVTMVAVTIGWFWRRYR